MRPLFPAFALIAIVSADSCPPRNPLCTTTAKAKPRYNCGTKGYLRRPSPVGAPCTAFTAQDCRETCLANSQCITFGYAASNMTCTTYGRDLPHQVYKDRKTDLGVVFYNRGCFTRTCCDEGQERCSGTCVDVQTDPENCGTCGHMCASGACEAGQCTCTDTLTDPDNCGTCGNTCPSGTCVHGVCTEPACAGAVCGNPLDCPNSETPCNCFDTSSGPFCLDDSACGGSSCSSNDNCPAGYICATNTCCDNSRCFQSTATCANTGSAKSLFRTGASTGGSNDRRVSR